MQKAEVSSQELRIHLCVIPSETRKCEQGASEGSTELAVVLNKHDSMSTLGLLKGDEINDA